MIIDTHAHLTDKHFAELQPFLDKAKEASVCGMLAVATTAKDSRECIDLAKRYSQIRASVGIHPNYCHQVEQGDWEVVEELCKDSRVAALGETGLDKYWDDCPWDVQVDFFRRHLALSRQTNLPVIIHTRECAEETLEILSQEYQKFGPSPGVMHSFTGPLKVALGCLELGLYISFAGMLTFKNAEEIREIAKEIPEDRILVETDSPYLTPHPFRGQRPNHPALVAETLSCLAETRGISKNHCAEITTGNAERLFGSW
jgi:TatD DNase family protein